MNTKAVLQSSETWVTLGVVVGQLLVQFNIVPKEQWDNVLYPALVYIVSRVTSKVAKKVV